jgi:hypothetical protein
MPGDHSSELIGEEIEQVAAGEPGRAGDEDRIRHVNG